MLSIEEAQQRILGGVDVLDDELVPIGEARARVLAEELRATLSQPPEDNSAMDGFAVVWPDVQAVHHGGSAVTVSVVDIIGAGGRPAKALVAGEAARIMTGAPIPEGADLVVMQEWASWSSDKSQVTIERSGPDGDNIRRAGEDVRQGEVLVEQGAVLTAADVGLAAAQGCSSLRCGRRPEVAILATGDEVHEPGEPLPEGHIYSGNSVALAGLVEEAGGVPRPLGIARDDPDSLREALERSRGADALVTVGGVSVGDFDHVKDVVAGLGAELEFWKVAMRPGKPNAFGSLFGSPWFGLPGNPVSCMVSFLQYVRPALLAMQGASSLFLTTVDAVLEEAVGSREGFLFLLRGIVEPDWTSGGYRVRTTGPQGSGILRSMAQANCLIVVPEEVSHLDAGQRVRVQLLPGPRPAQVASGLR
ncbi:MAG: molybdopterin biosynthesis protein MoeA [Deltaproteobacteria bacterium]|nr:molybdopterin biosynthesis protein MoeA [Deltaproteobacteria bacterium]